MNELIHDETTPFHRCILQGYEPAPDCSGLRCGALSSPRAGPETGKNTHENQTGRPLFGLQKAAVLLCRTKGGLQTAAGKWFHFFPKTGAAMWQNRCFRANENRTQNRAPEAAGPCPGPKIASLQKELCLDRL